MLNAGLGIKDQGLDKGGGDKDLSSVICHLSFVPNIRVANPPYHAYMSGAESVYEQLSAEECARETVMLALRTARGLDLAEYQNFTGKDFLTEFIKPLKKHLALGSVELDGGFLRITDKYILLSNSVIVDFW